MFKKVDNIEKLKFFHKMESLVGNMEFNEICLLCTCFMISSSKIENVFAIK